MNEKGSGETVAQGGPPANASPVAQFFVPAAASLQERRPRILKHDDTFALFDHNGDAHAGPGSPEGVYHRDTRHLSHLYLTLDGARPMLLSSTLREDNATLTCDLTNPDLFDANGAMVLGHDLVHLRRSRFLWNATSFERLVLRNYDEETRKVSVELAFEADFADLFEVRGTAREKRGEMHAPEVSGNHVTLSYTGLDKERRTTLLAFDPLPTRLTGNRAVFEIELAPRATQALFLEVDCGSEGLRNLPPRRAFFTGLRDARRALRNASSRAASIVSSNEIFNEAARRSVADLYMLMTETPEGPYPYAGIPWFSAVFGRDAIITALETLWMDPAIARGVLGHLAANQATAVDPAADAEPGKILHEVRHGEMAQLGEVPFRRYYGSVDSTPLFVMLAGAYLRRTADLVTVRRIWPNLQAALSWISDYGDRDGDGFVEYGRQTDDGLINQGWKDSHDSVFHADGTLAKGPIALAEVQAYVYGAWQSAAEIAHRLGFADLAAEYEGLAAKLRKSFDAHFFDKALGTYVIALDGQKKPCRVLTSNAGHVLLTGLALPERAKSVVDTLMSPCFFCGWGVRTVAATEARYNPMSYHNGSVWPHDNALIAAGFARYGFKREAVRIFEGMFGASTYIDLRRLPELFCGFPRQRTQGPTFYPVACAPQAWAAGAPLLMMQACLGLGFDPEQSRITFEEPALPDFLDEVTLRNLAIDGRSVDVNLRRSGTQVLVDVTDRRGPIRVMATS
ncbi:amylo-alpha-1,6-glucosidase [Roseococcus pinisoli]|uniref:Amylo-alpha-1,6-glucosidase n=1 Tax=Roseococcus pinisoli TaxID=2835040 RepID=A0ABS5QAB3_9PROT|nr:amylo-alpha-1,6-glucosidase [Roseococcus pinisoli]